MILHGRRLEVRLGDFGGEEVLLDGRIVAKDPYAGLSHPSHFFEIDDEQGRARHVEVKRRDLSKLGLGKYRFFVLVDGVERARLEPVDPTTPPTICPNCGYDLAGLPIEADEVRCPECGRHQPAPHREPA